MLWEDPEIGPAVQPIKQPKRVVYHIVRVYMLAIIVFAILMLVHYYFEPNDAIYILFHIFVSIYHFIAIIDEYQVDSEHFKILVSSNFHYLVYMIYNWFVSYTPTFYLLELILANGVGFVIYMVKVLMPYADLNDPISTKRIVDMTNSKFVTMTPTIIEIVILVRYIVYVFADFSLLRIIDLLMYVFWIIFYNYTSNQVSRSIWNAFLQRIEQASYDKRFLEPVFKAATSIAEFSDKLYGRHKSLN